jgi:hypothetical protein
MVLPRGIIYTYPGEEGLENRVLDTQRCRNTDDMVNA